MTKTLRGLLFATLAGVLTFGAAASLNLDADDLGAGSDAVESCDTDGVRVRWNTETPAANEFLNLVTITGIADRCIGQEIRFTVTDAGGTVLGFGVGTVNDVPDPFEPEALISVNTSGGPDVALADIAGIAVTISGIPTSS